MGDYTIENVIFESRPGFLVTANLYRPKAAATGKRPAILCPIGHYTAFKIARRIIKEGEFDGFLADRYSSYDSGFGREIEKGRVGFRDLEKLVLTKLGEPVPRSGRQEFLENMLNRYLTGG